MKLDRFACGLPDRQNQEPVSRCYSCGGEIYAGEEVYVIDENIVHFEMNCLLNYPNLEICTIEEATK